MITNVYKAIHRHLRDATVDLHRSESWVDGEYVPVYATGVSKSLAILPLSNRDLNFSDGAYTYQDKAVYELGSGTIPDKSIITFDGDKYLVDGGTRRNFEGGFTRYMAKRISETE